MNSFLKRFAILAISVSAASSVYAACSSGSACENPASNGSAATWTASASGMTGIQCLDSVGPNGNQAGSHYFFAAVTTNLGATSAKGTISSTGDGTQVIGVFALNSGSTPGSTVTGGSVNQLLGGQTYFFYAEACPSTGGLDSANCSVWVQIGSKSSLAYPASVFSAPTKPTDATNTTIAARTNVPAADINNISEIELEIDNMLNAGLDQTGIFIPWPGANQANPIDSTEYTTGGGFKPNVKYQYKGQVFYPYGVAVPTGGAQTEGPFWTTPDNPSNVVVSNVTHCSADITANNAAGTPANPTYTTYQLCATGTAGSCLNGAIGGTGIPGDTISKTITGLNPGTTYTPNAQALVGNGDGSQAGWNSSAIVNGSNFTTAGTNGTFTISAITTTGGTFNFPVGFDVSGATSWQILLNGAATGPSGSGLPPMSIPITGLNSNTAYAVQIQITEASCSYKVPQPGTTFDTLPVAPTAGSFGTATTTTLVVNWTDGSTNGAGTTYHLQYSSNGGTTWTDFATNPAKAGGSAQTTTITGLTPETTYNVRVKTVSISGNTANDSAYFQIPGTATTLNAAPVVNTVTCSVPTGSPSTSSCSGVATDNGTLTQLLCHWSATGPGTVLFNPATDQNADAGGNCPAVTATFPTNGSYTVTLTVTDHNGTGLSGSKNTTVNVGQTPTSISITPNSATVITGNTQTFNATVLDQFGATIVGQAVNWVVSGGGSVAPANGTSTVFTAATPGGPFTLTASLTGATNGTASITVIAAGPHVDSFNFTPSVNGNGAVLGGMLTLIGHDNVIHSITATYSSSPSGVTFTPPSTTEPDTVAANVAVQFPGAGTYTLTANLGSGVTASTVYTVQQVLSGLKICEMGDSSCSNLVTVKTLQDAQFDAVGADQFGNAMSASTFKSITWAGAIGNGAQASFDSASIGTNIKISATGVDQSNHSQTGSITVNVVSFDVSGAYAFPVPYKASSGQGTIHFTGMGNQWTLHLYTTSGRRIFDVTGNTNTFDWNIKNTAGESVASGVYFYVIKSPEGEKDGKLIIIQ